MSDQSQPASGESMDVSRIWLPTILGSIASFLPPNEATCTLRLVNSVACAATEQYTVVCLGKPVPAESFAAHWSTPDAYQGLTRDQRLRLLCLTAATGDLANLEVALETAGLYFGHVEVGVELMSAAAAAGEVEACSWLWQHGCPISGRTRDGWKLRSAVFAAARANQRAACEWLLAHGAASLEAALIGAIRGRHTDLVEWLLEEGAGVGDKAVMAAAEAGPPELVQRLLDDYLSKRDAEDYPSHRLVPCIAKGCNLETLQQLWPRLSPLQTHEYIKGLIIEATAASPTPDWEAKVTWLAEGGIPTARVGVEAAGCPDAVERLTWLGQALGYRPQTDCLQPAVRSGNTDAVRFLLSRGLDGGRCTDDMYRGPAGVSLEVLRLLSDGGKLLYPAAAFVQALLGADVDAAAFLLEVCRAGAGAGGGPIGVGFGDTIWELQTSGQLNARHFAWAAQSGSVRMMAWLREQGCPLGPEVWNTFFNGLMEDENTFPPQVGAANSGCPAALEWLAEAGCGMPTTGMPYVTAASNGDLQTLAVLHGLGVPFGPPDGSALILAMTWGALVPALRWLVEAGAPVHWGRLHHTAAMLRGCGPFDLAEELAWIEEERAAAGAGQEEEEEEETEEEEEEEGEKKEKGADANPV